MKTEFKIGNSIDVKHGNEWTLNYATILYFKNDNTAVAEMNYPGHDGCRWAHSYDLKSENIRLSAKLGK